MTVDRALGHAVGELLHGDRLGDHHFAHQLGLRLLVACRAACRGGGAWRRARDRGRGRSRSWRWSTVRRRADVDFLAGLAGRTLGRGAVGAAGILELGGTDHRTRSAGGRRRGAGAAAIGLARRRRRQIGQTGVATRRGACRAGTAGGRRPCLARYARDLGDVLEGLLPRPWRGRGLRPRGSPGRGFRGGAHLPRRGGRRRCAGAAWSSAARAPAWASTRLRASDSVALRPGCGRGAAAAAMRTRRLARLNLRRLRGGGTRRRRCAAGAPGARSDGRRASASRPPPSTRRAATSGAAAESRPTLQRQGLLAGASPSQSCRRYQPCILQISSCGGRCAGCIRRNVPSGQVFRSDEAG